MYVCGREVCEHVCTCVFEFKSALCCAFYLQMHTATFPLCADSWRGV